jgi:hypothetical protein
MRSPVATRARQHTSLRNSFLARIVESRFLRIVSFAWISLDPIYTWNMTDERSGYWQDTALVCLNGHLINSGGTLHPVDNTKFCEKCGEATVRNCPVCNDIIRGNVNFQTGRSTVIKSPPHFCHNCGKAYPWTERALATAKELVELSTAIKESEKPQVIEAIIVSSTGTSQASVGAETLKKYWPVLGSTLKDVVTNVLSETAKKILLGP